MGWNFFLGLSNPGVAMRALYFFRFFRRESITHFPGTPLTTSMTASLATELFHRLCAFTGTFGSYTRLEICGFLAESLSMDQLSVLINSLIDAIHFDTSCATLRSGIQFRQASKYLSSSKVDIRHTLRVSVATQTPMRSLAMPSIFVLPWNRLAHVLSTCLKLYPS